MSLSPRTPNQLSSNSTLRSTEDLFDRLPEEVISRIFTIGAEIEDGRNRHAIGSLGMNPLVEPKPYGFIAKIRSVCRRFHQITLMKSNAHFYYIIATTTRPREDGENFSSSEVHLDLAQFQRALKASKGCDIHIDIMCQRQQETRIALHALQDALPYKRQLASIKILDTYPSPSVLSWIFRWLGSKGTYRRLYHLAIHSHEYRFPHWNRIAPINTDSYEDGISPLDDLDFQFPSLELLELGPLPVGCMPPLSHMTNLRIVVLLPDSFNQNHIYYEWPAVANMLVTCSTLWMLQVLLRNIEPLRDSDSQSTMVSRLTHLVVIADPRSHIILFQSISFAYLVEAEVSIFDPVDEIPTGQTVPFATLKDIHLPVIRKLGFADASRQGVAFLELYVAPTLTGLAIALRSFTSTARHELRLGSPQTLKVYSLDVANDVAPSIFESMDLSETEELYLNLRSSPISRDSDGTSGSIGGGRQIHLPKLASIAILGALSFFEILNWLQSQFQLPTRFSIFINDDYFFEMMSKADFDGGAETFGVQALTLHDNFSDDYHFTMNASRSFVANLISIIP